MTVDTSTRPRTVVTGIGVTAPNGIGLPAYWQATLAGESAVGPLTRFDPGGYRARLAGEVSGFDPAGHLPGRLLPQTDHMTRLALVAADGALRDASVEPGTVPPDHLAVVTAATAGGYEFGQRELQNLWQEGTESVSTYQSFAWFYAVNTGQISIRHGCRGPGAVVVSDQAGGLDAVGHARRQLRNGARLVLTGGVDSALCPWGWVAIQAGGSVTGRTDPARAYLPFDVDADGYVPGEGGAILTLERWQEPAGDRPGARAYGEIAGYAATFDPGRPGRPPGLRRAAELALADAGMAPGDIDVVFADAAGTPEQDRAEADAITGIFGPGAVPVTAPKTMTGRLFAGGGSLDLAAALLSVSEGVIPPTVHVRQVPADYQLDLVRDVPREQPVRAALVLARGRGGFSSAMVVARAT